MQVSAWRLGVLASLAPTPATGGSEEFWTKMYLLKAWRVSKRWKLERNLQLKSKLGGGTRASRATHRRDAWERSAPRHRGRRRRQGTPPRMRHTEGQPRRRRRGFGRDTPADEGAPVSYAVKCAPSLDPTILLLGVIQEKWNVSAKGPCSNVHSGFVRVTKN